MTAARGGDRRKAVSPPHHIIPAAPSFLLRSHPGISLSLSLSLSTAESRALLRKVPERRTDGRTIERRCGGVRPGARSEGLSRRRRRRLCDSFRFFSGGTTVNAAAFSLARSAPFLLADSGKQSGRQVANRVTPHPAYSIAPAAAIRKGRERPAYSNCRWPKREIVCLYQ